MVVRDGFLLLDVMVALFLFMAFAYLIVRWQGDIVQMHRYLKVLADEVTMLRETLEGRSERTFLAKCELRVVATKMSGNTLPLYAIQIQPLKNKRGKNFEMIAWVYE